MREILFRGKRIDDSKWVYGSMISFDDGKKTILPSKAKVFMQQGTTTICCNECYDVDIATVGQYTGMTDKNGVKIFEGDIVVWDYAEVDFDGSTHSTSELVRWDKDYCGFIVNDDGEGTIDKNCRVIGNIHDNPELLEGEQK